MKRLITAPNLALATLWADWLTQAGMPTQVQRAYASSIAGEVPVDQTLPELWVMQDEQHTRALQVLGELQRPRYGRWSCRGCGEVVEGGFEVCWNCGAEGPG